jgi:hypothetical protein
MAINHDPIKFARFVEGLRKYNLTYDEMVESGWRYAGGDGAHMIDGNVEFDDCSRHYRYFKLCFPSMERLAHTHKCLCGHYIVEDCYISDFKGNFIIIGNCCIKQFVPLCKRTCSICKDPHRNRKVNICNPCRGAKGKSYKYKTPPISKRVRKWDWRNWTMTAPDGYGSEEEVDIHIDVEVLSGHRGIIQDYALVEAFPVSM